MKILFTLAIAGLLSAVAHAGGNNSNDADLQQVVDLASKGQSAQTRGEVQQYVNDHQEQISGVLDGYRAYFNQVQAMSDPDSQGAAASSRPGAAAPAPPQQQNAAQNNAGAGGQAGLQASSGLQMPSLQTSGELTMPHLAGSSPLPDVDAASSVPHPDAVQLQYAAQVQAAQQARKRELMAAPAVPLD